MYREYGREFGILADAAGKALLVHQVATVAYQAIVSGGRIFLQEAAANGGGQMVGAIAGGAGTISTGISIAGVQQIAKALGISVEAALNVVMQASGKIAANATVAMSAMGPDEIEKFMGEYSKVGGHHVHAKSGFRSHPSYDPKKGFSISQEFMKQKGWRHEKMTMKQMELFMNLAESGEANTLAAHTQIAIKSLMAGGASEEEAIDVVKLSLQDLLENGVTEPMRIPWTKP